MIESYILTTFTPIVFIVAAVTMIVLRTGASMVFFDIVGTFQSQRLIKDAGAASVALEGLMVDGFANIGEAAGELNEIFEEMHLAFVPLAEDIERSRIEFEKFIDNKERVDDLARAVTNIGAEYGYVGAEALKAGARTAQLTSILGEAAVPAATEMGIAFGMIGEMDAETAMTTLINLMQQTEFVFDGTTKAAYAQMDGIGRAEVVTRNFANTLNTLNSIEDNSASNMMQLTETLEKFAAQGHLTGESISFMAAMSAVLVEAGEDAGKAGTAMKMIYARLGGDINGAATALQDMGIATHRTDGSLRSLSEILTDLHDAGFKNMSAARKQDIALQVAGNRHYVRFLKLAENFDRAILLNTYGMEQSNAVFTETGDAVGYLSDRLQENVHQLDVQRAKLANVEAELGKKLIPAEIASIKTNIAMKESYIDIMNALDNLSPALGDTAQALAGSRKIISDSFAPFFNTYIGIRSSNLALMTQIQIMRAVSGERIAGFDNEMRFSSARNDMIRQENNMQVMSIRIQMLKNGMTAEEAKNQIIILDRLRMETEAKLFNSRLDLHKRKIQMDGLRDQIKGIQFQREELINSQRKLISEIKVKQNKKEIRILNLKTSIEKKQQLAKEIRMNTDLSTIEQNAAIQKLNMGKEEGQLINATSALKKMGLKIDAAELQMTNLQSHGLRDIEKIQARISLIKNTDKSTERELHMLNQQIQALRTIESVEEMDRLSDGLGMLGARAQDARLGMGGLSMDMNFAMIGMMLATSATMALGGSMKDGTQKMRIQRTAAIAMGLSTIMMTVQMAAAQYQMIRLSGTMINGGLAADKAAASNYNLAASNMAVAKSAGAASMGIRGLLVASGVGIGVLVLSYGIAFLAEKLGVFDVAVDDTIEGLDELLEVGDNNTAWIDDFSSSLQDGEDAMAKFNDSREEMFYGFKAGNTIGSLVKQVKQGGVENFVANTEVIMTNNFNGMTTRQVAEEIIELIQDEAGIQGINTSMASLG